MNNKLVDELYEMADKYQGRIHELLLLAVAEIQKQDYIINQLKKNEEDK